MRKGLVDAEAHNERESKRQARTQAHGARVARRAGGGDVEEGESEENQRTAWESLEIEEYGPFYVQDYTSFFMTSSPLDFFSEMVDYLKSKQIAHHISSESLRMNFIARIGSNASTEEESKEESSKEVKVDVQVLKVNENKSCVKFTYKDPTQKVDVRKTQDIINHFLSFRNADKLRMFVDTTFEEDH